MRAVGLNMCSPRDGQIALWRRAASTVPSAECWPASYRESGTWPAGLGHGRRGFLPQDAANIRAVPSSTGPGSSRVLPHLPRAISFFFFFAAAFYWLGWSCSVDDPLIAVANGSGGERSHVRYGTASR